MRHKLFALLATVFCTLVFAVGCGSGTEPASTTAAPGPPSTYELQVTGMTCEGCASAITESLESLPGVASVKVDHAAGTAIVVAAENPELPAKATKLITELGFEAAPAPKANQ